MAEDFTVITVNERLFVAGLLDAYDDAVATGDPAVINAVLRQVNLRQDETGMSWPITIEHLRDGVVGKTE